MLTLCAISATLAFAAPEAGAEVDRAAPVESTTSVSDALSIDAEGSCLAHERLTERIVFWLKRDAVDSRLTIEVASEPETDGVRYVIKSEGEFVSERPFEWTTDDCADRHFVFALSIAMALDATVLADVAPTPVAPKPEEPKPEEPKSEEPKPEEPKPEEPKPEEPKPEEPKPEEPKPEEPRRRRGPAVRAIAHGVLTIGTPTGLGGGGDIGLELGWRDLFDVDGRLFVSSSGEQSFAGGRFTSTLVTGRLTGCVGPKLGRVRPRACVGVVSGIVVAQGREFLQAGRARLPWVGFALGGNVRVDLTSRFALDFGLEGVGTAVQPIFQVDADAGASEREFARFGVLAGIGLAVQLR